MRKLFVILATIFAFASRSEDPIYEENPDDLVNPLTTASSSRILHPGIETGVICHTMG